MCSTISGFCGFRPVSIIRVGRSKTLHSQNMGIPRKFEETIESRHLEAKVNGRLTLWDLTEKIPGNLVGHLS